MKVIHESSRQKVRRSLFANVVNVILSTLTGVLIPKCLGATQYGYWQMMALFMTYLPYLHLGWVDGMFLRLGEKKEGQVDYPLLHSEFLWFCVYDILVSGIFFLCALASHHADIRLVLACTAIECLVLLPRVYFQYVLQATDKVGLYARNFVLERILISSCQIVMLALGKGDFLHIALCEIGGKAVMLLAILRSGREVLQAPKVGMRQAWNSIGEDFYRGFKVTFATISGMLLLGIVQFSIEYTWPIETFGMVSFALVALICTVQFLNQFSVVLYPLVVQSPHGMYGKLAHNSGLSTMKITALVGLFYFPLEALMQWFLPEYHQAIWYISCLLPVIFFESRTTPVLNTFLKASHQESKLLSINVVMMVVSGWTTILTVLVRHDLTMVIFSIVFLLGIRMLLTEYMVWKHVRIINISDLSWLLVLAAASLVGYAVIDGLEGWLLYVAVFLAFVLANRKDLKQAHLAG